MRVYVYVYMHYVYMHIHMHLYVSKDVNNRTSNYLVQVYAYMCVMVKLST